MHMSDALISPTVAAVTGVGAIVLTAIAIQKTAQPQTEGNAPHTHSLFPLMGVLGAFIFAAQMINFTIPGTGSSGHIVGGILLAAILGPWASFLTLTAVLIIQCLIFADGGLLALGCNIINMAAMSCLVAYPMFFRNIMVPNATTLRLSIASITASIMALFFGAVAVTIETSLSGVTALPMRQFLVYMVAIHLAVGICEGVATAAILAIVKRYRKDLILDMNKDSAPQHRRMGRILSTFAIVALAIGASFSWIASSKPDGLEWSIERVAGGEELALPDTDYHSSALRIQEQTALIPDYNTSLAGILGSGAIILVVFIVTYIFSPRTKP